MIEKELIRRVGELKPAVRGGEQALHRPLLMLWAIGQVVGGSPREHRWSTVREALEPLLITYAGAPPGEQQVVYPFWALQRNHLWEVSNDKDLALTSKGRRPTLSALNSTDPVAGLLPEDFELLSSDRGLAAQVAGSLLLRFFDTLPSGLIDAVGLSDLLGGRVDTALRPRVGESFASRKEIARVYGGNDVMGITPLKDRILTVYSDDKGPYPDSRIPETDWITYIGDGLRGDQELKAGNSSMQQYQNQERALRYWHKPAGGTWSFATWAVIVQLGRRWSDGDDGVPRRAFEWILVPVPSPFRETWPEDVLAALAEDDGSVCDYTEEVPAPDVVEPLSDQERYRRLTSAAHAISKSRSSRSTTAQVERFYRSRAARDAVLLRSGARCENETCLGHSFERTDKGAPLLEVDHVNDLARDGADTPETMIALCPNCHALKTRGSNRRRLRHALLKIAGERHARFASDLSA
ncbi:HNH endonuclease [Streptomyces sp. NPDC048507]|uniref:HNH endonuclease n=1 Tax=Streptomyces sp. NPDC048507 TaxID=3365560 RepID=UPI003721688C